MFMRKNEYVALLRETLELRNQFSVNVKQHRVEFLSSENPEISTVANFLFQNKIKYNLERTPDGGYYITLKNPVSMVKFHHALTEEKKAIDNDQPRRIYKY